MSATSTSYFPGAPVNTDPLNTMATSTAGTTTSPSTASTVPTAATTTAPTVAPASTSTAPDATTAADDARATSAASNPTDKEKEKDKEKPPDSADPATSATTSTTTSNTTTTNTTAGGATTTTTTAATGTTATGRTSPTIPLQAQFNDCIARCNNCLFLIRKLRAKQNSIINLFLYREDEADFYGIPYFDYSDFGTLLQEVMDTYNKLDYYSKRLPKVVPPIDNVNVMRTLYSQEHTMAHTNINYLVEKMIDSGNWNEGNYQVFYYLSELLRVHGQRKRLMEYNELKPNPVIQFKTIATTGHAAFETAYKQMKKDILQKSLGIYPRTIIHNSTGLTVEFLFGSGGTKVVSNHDVVFTMKFLIVERHGHIEYLNMIAPHEEWVKYNNFSQVTINPFAPSRYEVYRRLTKQANIHLLNCFGAHQSRWTAHTLITFVSLFGKFREVFSTRCRACKQVTKNFMPPLNFDIRSPNIAYHDNCR